MVFLILERAAASYFIESYEKIRNPVIGLSLVLVNVSFSLLHVINLSRV